MMMKKLTRIRLINWHYFVNETILVNGSFLVSGENTAGKSTIMDAIQLVLTTNHRRFNTAANEKSSRNLKGYVRCKTGNEGNAYLRKGSVISYVALEFFEEKTGKYFTIGVKIDSRDEESSLGIKWFREECQLEALSFVTAGRPSTTEEFRRRDRKVQLISQVYEAKAQFGRRLGNLEDRFFDMIPKSLAFKPMDNVKDFINKFILAEKAIEVSSLRQNIAALKEFEELMAMTQEKIKDLEIILSRHETMILRERDIKINEILIDKAVIEAKKQELDQLEGRYQNNQQRLAREQQAAAALTIEIDHERERLIQLQVALGQNETAQLIASSKNQIELLKKDRDIAEAANKKLKAMLGQINDALKALSDEGVVITTREAVLNLGAADGTVKDQGDTLFALKKAVKTQGESYQLDLARKKDELDGYKARKIQLEKEIEDLKNKKLTFPMNTVRLLTAIEKAFREQGIRSTPRIFSDLLEITDPRWQNAVEGYLNTQRFYIIVEPQHYPEALSVYNRIKKEVHTVGLVNTGKLKLQAQTDVDSLGYVVTSDNRYAMAYSQFLLNRVIRCEDVSQLKEFRVAITPDCMLYQNYAVRKINAEVYQTPFIGASAYEIQLKNKEAEQTVLDASIAVARQRLTVLNNLVVKLNLCKLDVIEENLEVPQKLKSLEKSIAHEREALKKAEANPNFIELQIQVQSSEKRNQEMAREHSLILETIGGMKEQLEATLNQIKSIEKESAALEKQFEYSCEQEPQAAKLGLEKFMDQIRSKTPATIVANFSPHTAGLEKKKNELGIEIMGLQLNYCKKYEGDLGTGPEQIQEYRNEYHKLVSADIIRFEEDLQKAKDNCHLEFRESFLARLKENIDNARLEFKSLNGALKDIYYGEDSYYFELTPNKKKECIYQMITSPKNIDGFNLWSQSFEAEYKEEMEDLFAKLTAYDDKGEKVLTEYTDYRSYLDYDIIVNQKDGTSQRFSRIYGEKSGGETQTPYYVAIAASFVQLYQFGDTIRIIMLDEAFDKMDDNRIAAMMDFLNTQQFQIILATPPAKLEVIGEKVDTILMAMREGTTSIVEEYYL